MFGPTAEALEARLLGEHKAYVFSLIQKFNEDVMPDEPYSERADIIVVR